MNEQDREQMELWAAGSKPVERERVVIWHSSDDGFFYARETDLDTIREGTKPYVHECLEDGSA